MFLDIKTFPNKSIRFVRGLCCLDWLFSSFFICFYQNFSKQTRKTDFCFDNFFVFVLFCLIVFIQREGFSDSLHFV